MYFHYFATPVSLYLLRQGPQKPWGKTILIFYDIDSLEWKLENHTANFKSGFKSQRLYDQYFE